MWLLRNSCVSFQREALTHWTQSEPSHPSRVSITLFPKIKEKFLKTIPNKLRPLGASIVGVFCIRASWSPVLRHPIILAKSLPVRLGFEEDGQSKHCVSIVV